MIFLTGDTHGDITRLKLFNDNFSFYQDKYQINRNLNKNDYLIILGDFGVIWNNIPDKKEKEDLELIDSFSFTTAFITGNHSNYTRINSFPEEEFLGGIIHRISDSCIHLKTGYVFNIDNFNLFIFGGAQSIDKEQRIPYISWWPEEIPSYKEMELGINNIQNKQIDYVLTHTCPTNCLGYLLKTNYRIIDPLESMLNYYYTHINFKHWYFGHWHVDKQLTSKFTVLYNDIIKI